MRFMRTAPEKFQEYLTEARGFDKAVRGLDELSKHFQRHAYIEASIYKWSSRRKFCITENGNLACVPKTAQPGDVICVLFGGEVPYVLRPGLNDTYSVIGECYMNDIMHGEGLSSDTAAIEFRLC
ncbi:hypothetical protein F5884DRAFT_805359 [Xylogone sp. PMI_703]|nr:hypothetical protein F5884DRAFT_805359 [Xylogone sp. PMI_703]